MSKTIKVVVCPPTHPRPRDPPPPSSPKPSKPGNDVAGSLIHLTASTTLHSGSPGGVNTIALKNPTGAPMEILEIKFQFVLTATGPAGTPSGHLIFDGGGGIGVKFSLGTIPISSGYIPVWLLCKGDVMSNAFQSLGNSGWRSVYRWKLPRPLYIPAGGVLQPEFEHRGLTPNDVDVQISYSCRSLPMGSKPAKVCVPFAAAFLSKVMPVSGTAATDESSETDLVNSTPDNVFLQAINARVLGIVPFYTFVGDLMLSHFPYAVDALYAQLTDASGNPIIRSPLPFHTAFSAVDRGLEINGGVQLPPSAYYILSLDKQVQSGYTFADVGATLQAGVGLVGWREVSS